MRARLFSFFKEMGGKLPNVSPEEWWDKQIDEYYDNWLTPVPDPFDFPSASLDQGMWYTALDELESGPFTPTLIGRPPGRGEPGQESVKAGYLAV